ncbi:glycoside hydrolase family 1 protein [Thermoplasma sp.]|uniref:glycoside hydrolase family 1 protein n=1 Tax=Thermoplasma sp. TaxID=1973142 RepID=UPI00260B8176|nr:glycoside hydrolase family 1 protein [Thermoplasma sp.]
MKYKFPDNFLWGTAISAFQTEMGTSEDSISNASDWYVWTHDKDIIRKGLVSGDLPENGDGFWDLYRTDIDNAVSLNNNSIRLSLDWARIFRKQTFDVPSNIETEAGEIVDVQIPGSGLTLLDKLSDHRAIDHYKDIFEYARKRGLKVLLTVYHWPLPIWLHDPVNCHKDINNCVRKGWIDSRIIVEFAKYVEYVSKQFSEYVDIWETINEPEIISSQGYVFGNTAGFPPGLSDMGLGFTALKNLALANSIATKILKRNDPGKQVGVGINPAYYEAYSEDPASKMLAGYMKYLNNHWFLNAAVLGSFDTDMDGNEDVHINAITPPDYIGIDYYQRLIVKYNGNGENFSLSNLEFMPCHNCTDFMWDIYPSGMRHVLRDNYGTYHKPIYILENGIADANDAKRSSFIIDHLKELWASINEDKLPVKGYFHWTLMDNYEWARGFSMRFGLYEVDYNTKKRIKRRSADVYARICKENGLDDTE